MLRVDHVGSGKLVLKDISKTASQKETEALDLHGTEGVRNDSEIDTAVRGHSRSNPEKDTRLGTSKEGADDCRGSSSDSSRSVSLLHLMSTVAMAAPLASPTVA